MLPDILTTVRLGLVPIFAYLIIGTENFYLAAFVFVLSGLTDIADGFIARKYNMITNFGKIYDPFVDKLMQVSTIVCLVIKGVVPFWLLIFALLKEVTMIIIGGILYLKKIVVCSNWFGKTATVVFYAGVLTIIVWRNIPTSITMLVFFVMVVAMLIAACSYVYDTVRHFDKKDCKS